MEQYKYYDEDPRLNKASSSQPEPKYKYYDEDPRIQKPTLRQPVAVHEQQQPSRLKRAGQFVGGLLTRGVQGPLNMVESLQDLSSNPITSASSLPLYIGSKANQIIRDKLNVPKGSQKVENYGKKLFGDIEPENIVSKGLQYTAGNWPLLFLGGAPTAAKLGADIAGSTALAATEKVTDNPIVGIGAHILGQKKFHHASNYLKNVYRGLDYSKIIKEPGRIRTYINNLYDKEKSLGAKVPVNKDIIESKLSEIGNDLSNEYTHSRRFSSRAKKEITKNLAKADESLKKLNLTVSDLTAQKRLLNKGWSSEKSIENHYHNRIIKAFTDQIDDIAKKNPEWGNVYKAADELHTIDKWQSGLGKWMEKYSAKGKLSSLVPNPIAQSALSILGGLYSGTPLAIAGSVTPPVLKGIVKGKDVAQKGTSFLIALGKRSDGRRLLMNIVADSAQENANALTKNIHKFNKMAEKYNQEEDQWEDFG